ncbi:MAG: restriction endonuclease subunit S [Thermodesulfobacteriota bacterium]|nr:restriction endonuclease subunit S [Thermodesulfobacteriota bacterium]
MARQKQAMRKEGTDQSGRRDVPPGYKRTEVGVIPEDWGTPRIDKHANIFTGSKDTQDKKEGGSYPFFVRSQQVERINSYSYDGEAILTAGDGVGTGKVFHYINGRFDVHQRVYIIADFSKQLDGKYFFYQFSHNFHSRIISMTAKSSVDSVRMETIAGMPIPLPKLKEQHAIAAALSDADALIDGLDRLIAKKRAIKQAAMQQLLTGQTRLPGFEGEWTELSMSRHAILKARIGWQGLRTDEYLSSGGHYLITGTDFENGGINWSGCYFVDQWRYAQDKNIQLSAGDILLTKDGTIGKVGYVNTLPGPATLNSGVYVIRPVGEAFDPKFMFYLLASSIFEDFLKKLQAGSTISHLYQKDFAGFSFYAPSIDEQRAIAAVLSDMDAEIQALEHRRDKARQIKQGMMQQLLTGRVRLVNQGDVPNE